VDLAPTRPITRDPLVLRVSLGPRDDWLADPAELSRPAWVVSPDSDRVGVRLTGSEVRRHPTRIDAELPSEGVVRGAIQIPADGQPVLFLADHPVTGGYPVAGVISAADVDSVAQAVPGQEVRLVLVAN
jgi:allophanate hydrolase subunit 2